MPCVWLEIELKTGHRLSTGRLLTSEAPSLILYARSVAGSRAINTQEINNQAGGAFAFSSVRLSTVLSAFDRTGIPGARLAQVHTIDVQA